MDRYLVKFEGLDGTHLANLELEGDGLDKVESDVLNLLSQEFIQVYKDEMNSHYLAKKAISKYEIHQLPAIV